MSYIVGIDVGGSTTKIVAFDHNENIVAPMFVTAEDQMTSIYGAFGKFTSTNNIKLSDVDKIMITGVGSTFIGEELYGIECQHVSEFQSVGIGGQYLSGLDRAPERFIMTSCCANGGEGYLPTKEAFHEIGYEAGSSPFSENLEEECVKAAIEMLNR